MPFLATRETGSSRGLARCCIKPFITTKLGSLHPRLPASGRVQWQALYAQQGFTPTGNLKHRNRLHLKAPSADLRGWGQQWPPHICAHWAARKTSLPNLTTQNPETTGQVEATGWAEADFQSFRAESGCASIF